MKWNPWKKQKEEINKSPQDKFSDEDVYRRAYNFGDFLYKKISTDIDNLEASKNVINIEIKESLNIINKSLKRYVKVLLFQANNREMTQENNRLHISILQSQSLDQEIKFSGNVEKLISDLILRKKAVKESLENLKILREEYRKSLKE